MALIVTKLSNNIIRSYNTVTKYGENIESPNWSAVLTPASLTINAFGKIVGVIYTDQALNQGNSIFSYTVPSDVPASSYSGQSGTTSGGGGGGGGGLSVVTSPAAFIGGRQPGDRAFIRQVGGASPSFTGYKEMPGNLGFDTAANAINIIQLFYDGVDYWYSIFGEIGATATPAPIQTITNLRTNAAGTQLLFDNSGTALTALTGTITVAGTARALTFVSATVASIPAPAITTGQVLTATFTATTPALPVAVTNTAVTNSVAAAGLTKRSITWANPPAVTVTGDVASFSGAGASVSTPIDTTQPFEVLFRSSRAADVFILDDAIATAWTWVPPASERIAGAFINGGVRIVNASQAAGTVTTGDQAATAFQTYFKFRKSGNDIIMATSLDNVTYVDAFTYAGVLTGVPILYSSVYNVSGAATTTPAVSYYA